MKAVLTDERFSDPGWIFERKLDGIRCVAIARRRRGAAALAQRPVARTGATRRSPRRWTREPRRRFAVDGEVVAFDGAQTSFARLAAARPAAACAVFFYVFDLLWLDGHDVRALPLRARKRLLRDALDFRRPAALDARTATRDGEALFARGLPQGLGGVIAKRADSPYTARALARLAEVQVRGRARSW